MSVIDDCEQMDHLPVEVMRFRDNILTFKQLEWELFHESWLRFKALFIQFSTHEIPDLVLLECFYRSLNSGSKGLIDQLITGCLMRHSYETVAKLLDLIPNTNKETEKDRHSVILLGQMHTLSQKVKELEVLSKMKGRYMPPHERRKSTDNESRRIENTLLIILQNLKEQDRVLEEMRENVEVLNHRIGSHSRSIKLIENLIGHIGELKSSRQNAKEVGDPDLNRHWTQDNFKVESVKLGEPRKLLASCRLVRRS
uniref:Uncharacterized protein n=1 Tax=Solanum tuberosum TaxID=4113 RepID=M1DV52_SOLTU